VRCFSTLRPPTPESITPMGALTAIAGHIEMARYDL
jgi:hypothetical protein